MQQVLNIQVGLKFKLKDIYNTNQGSGSQRHFNRR